MDVIARGNYLIVTCLMFFVSNAFGNFLPTTNHHHHLYSGDIWSPTISHSRISSDPCSPYKHVIVPHAAFSPPRVCLEVLGPLRNDWQGTQVSKHRSCSGPLSLSFHCGRLHQRNLAGPRRHLLAKVGKCNTRNLRFFSFFHLSVADCQAADNSFHSGLLLLL